MAIDTQLVPSGPALSFLSSLLPYNQLPLASMALNSTANAYLASKSFWGPVTATLDWCEVSSAPTIAIRRLSQGYVTAVLIDCRRSLIQSPLPGQLSVLPLYSGGRKYLLEPRHGRARSIWGGAIGMGGAPAKVSCRVHGTPVFSACNTVHKAEAAERVLRWLG